MTAGRMRIAKLGKAQLTQVRALEKKLGCCVVALAPAPRPARLSKPQIKQIQASEEKLGVVLVAYDTR